MDHMKSMSFEVKERKNKKKELFFVRQICFDDDIFEKKEIFTSSLHSSNKTDRKNQFSRRRRRIGRHHSVTISLSLSR